MARVEVMALGEIEVLVNQARQDLGGPKNRHLMALFVANPDRVLSADWLIDGLWGEEPPPSARKSLQVHISRIRHVLGDPSPLITEPGGYRLDSSRASVDTVRFETAIVAAQDRTADPGCNLESGLRLWRGTPFGEFGTQPTLQGEVTRLTDLRQTGLVVLVDHMLAADHAAEALQQLDPAIAEYPYNEKFWSSQMLALYRSGRQTEALRSYRKLHDVLGSDLGIEPSTDLRRLEENILLHDESLDLHPAAAPAQDPAPKTQRRTTGRSWNRGTKRLVAAIGTVLVLPMVGAFGFGVYGTAEFGPAKPPLVWYITDLPAPFSGERRELAVGFEGLGFQPQIFFDTQTPLVCQVDRRPWSGEGAHGGPVLFSSVAFVRPGVCTLSAKLAAGNGFAGWWQERTFEITHDGNPVGGHVASVE